jgi:hypothetical protein
MICKICDRDLEIPDGAILIRRRFGNEMYLFPGVNGLVHEFKIVKPTPTPKPAAVPAVLDQIELLETVIEVLKDLPQPQPELEKPKPIYAEPESESEQPETTMAAAFKRFNK